MIGKEFGVFSRIFGVWKPAPAKSSFPIFIGYYDFLIRHIDSPGSHLRLGIGAQPRPDPIQVWFAAGVLAEGDLGTFFQLSGGRRKKLKKAVDIFCRGAYFCAKLSGWK
jgi:hypothetical protein